ncbi:MAG: polysaccharide deacetylase family protein [Mobilicoccus sp.]|nr:polysaccharide deacetylase family protein [Mobilicoccus sp.]
MKTVRPRLFAAALALAAIATTAVAAPQASAAPAPRTPAKVVYLTFDDGPSRHTPAVLDVLKKHEAKGTFFMVGSAARANPTVVRRVKAEGHAVGNHTFTHPWLTKRSAQAIRTELRRTDAVIGRTTCMRPPGGFVSPTVRQVAKTEGKQVILWSVDPADWRRPGVQSITNGVLRAARPGSVVLMHDGGGDRTQSVQALDRVLTRLSAQGYRFETLPACR